MSVDDTLIVEILKKIQSGLVRLEEGQEDIKSRLTALEVTVSTVLTVIGTMAGSVAQQQATLDRFDKRFMRIERRLEVVSGEP